MRRVRVHQAWYRATILGLTRYGSLASTNKPCGSVLADEDSERGLNFVGAASVETYHSRRSMGWGVDPVRCTKYLTSSQALTFNMLSEAVRWPEACALFFNTLLDRSDLAFLESSHFEFSAVNTPYWLGDRTIVDVLLRFVATNGDLQVIAVETKLADRFSKRRTGAMNGPSYLRLAGADGIWLDVVASLQSDMTRQITRCHALAQSVQSIDGMHSGRNAQMVILVHPEDSSGLKHANAYLDALRVGDGYVATWDSFLQSAGRTGAINRDLRESLACRYVDMSTSDGVWLAASGR